MSVSESNLFVANVPVVVWQLIFSHLSSKGLGNSSRVCKKWNSSIDQKVQLKVRLILENVKWLNGGAFLKKKLFQLECQIDLKKAWAETFNPDPHLQAHAFLSIVRSEKSGICPKVKEFLHSKNERYSNLAGRELRELGDVVRKILDIEAVRDIANAEKIAKAIENNFIKTFVLYPLQQRQRKFAEAAQTILNLKRFGNFFGRAQAVYEMAKEQAQYDLEGAKNTAQSLREIGLDEPYDDAYDVDSAWKEHAYLQIDYDLKGAKQSASYIGAKEMQYALVSDIIRKEAKDSPQDAIKTAEILEDVGSQVDMLVEIAKMQHQFDAKGAAETLKLAKSKALTIPNNVSHAKSLCSIAETMLANSKASKKEDDEKKDDADVSAAKKQRR